LNQFIRRYNRHLSAIGIVGLTLLLGGFDVSATAMRALEFEQLHSPLGGMADWLASLFTPPPSLVRAGSDRTELVHTLYQGGAALRAVLFAFCAWRALRPGVRHGAVGLAVLLGTQLLLALSADSELLYVLAVELALLLPLRWALFWLVLQMLLYATGQLYLAGAAAGLSDHQMQVRMLYLGMELIMFLIVFGVVYVAKLERRGRRSLAAAHAELLATQSLLGDMMRGAERLRIARDLHDSVGHHLTALNLHLDLALRQSTAPAPASLQTARELSSALLAEVRAVVSTERHDQRIDLRHALTTLCAGIPRPQIQLLMEEDLAIDSAAIAHTLFSCVQETISNAVRHSGAQTLTIQIARRGDELLLLTSDDGAGSRQAPEGNGLRGMRERLAALGGRLQTGDRQPRGFGMEISLPLLGGAQ
jgi:signal transduction histidine kinase